MSTIYVIALACVALVVLAAMLDAVIAVSRKSTWGSSRPRLLVVSTSERRQSDLPFVGRDRRRAATSVTDRQQAA